MTTRRLANVTDGVLESVDLSTCTGAPAAGPATELDANGTTLTVDAIADGEFLKRVGTTIVGATPSGAVSATTVETDIGSTLKFNGKFTITDAAISGTSKVLCWQAPGPYTNKGTRADEAEMQPVQVIAVEPGSGSAVVKWQTPPIFTTDFLSDRPAPNFGNGTAANSGTNRDYRPTTRRIGGVRGNVKFTYMVLS